MVLLFETAGIIEWGGFLIIAMLVFAETGLLLGLVIPGGETLLFTAGLLASSQTLDVSVTALLPVLIGAGLTGDVSGYFIGKKYSRRLYHKKDTWYFKKKYVHLAEDFLKKHSRPALIFGKFLPVIRPFCPVISGATRLPFPFFITLSVAACVLYMSTFILAGYFLGNRFPVIKDYLGWILPASIILSLVPVLLQARKQSRRSGKA